MSVEVIAIGGYQEVGKNMTAVKIGEDVIIFDMGIHLDRISMHEDTDIDRMHSLDLIERGVIPDDTLMKDVDGKVKGIIFSHGHLDHIGAVAKLAHRYDAPLIGTPYTTALIEKQIKGERKFKVNNPIRPLNAGSKLKLSKDITLEFVQSTHSIPQAVFPVLHTPEGIIVYALDFKFVSGITTEEAWKKAISKWSYGYKYRWVDKGGTIIHVQIGSSKPDRK